MNSDQMTMAFLLKRTAFTATVFLMLCISYGVRTQGVSESEEDAELPVKTQANTADLPEQSIPQKQDCRLDSFKLQEYFNLDRFQGYWYSLSINRYWFQLPSIIPFKQKNVQVHYKLLSDGTLELLTAGSFFGSLCEYMKGSGEVPNKLQPERLEVQFDTFLPRAAKKNNYWILKTDYDGFAAIYSCWKMLKNGTCDPDHAYMWTLNRKRGGHTPAQLEAIKEAAKSVCISPENFKTFEQDGGCKFDPDNYPRGGLNFVAFLVICAAIAVAIFGICFCCISKADKNARNKKLQ